jgi:hypothetical protein
MKNVVFWDVTPCGGCLNRRFGGAWRLHHQGDKNREAKKNVSPANVLSSSILVTLMMEAQNSSETSVLTRTTRRNITEDDILHSHRRENLKSYMSLTVWSPGIHSSR